MRFAASHSEHHASPNVIEKQWQEEHQRYPAMTKQTFVENLLGYYDESLRDLIAWAKRNKSLHGVPCESQGQIHTDFVQEESEGRFIARVDATKPYVAVRVGFEIVKAGEEPTLFRPRISKCKKGYWCSHQAASGELVDYLCVGCRPATDDDDLFARVRELGAVFEGIGEALDERDAQLGMDAAARRAEG